MCHFFDIAAWELFLIDERLYSFSMARESVYKEDNVGNEAGRYL